MNDGKPAAKRQLRHRCKGRCFDRAWSSYTDAFKQYWETLGRDAQKKLINANIHETSARCLENKIMQAFEWQETVRRRKLKESEVGSDGVIQEEAETRLGGRDRLERAILRGLHTWEFMLTLQPRGPLPIPWVPNQERCLPIPNTHPPLYPHPRQPRQGNIILPILIPQYQTKKDVCTSQTPKERCLTSKKLKMLEEMFIGKWFWGLGTRQKKMIVLPKPPKKDA